MGEVVGSVPISSDMFSKPSSTTTPAVVYFPAGTYLISSSIEPDFFTQLIGDPTDLPILKATADFAGFGLINGDPYYTSDLNWGSTNLFYRQVSCSHGRLVVPCPVALRPHGC